VGFLWLLGCEKHNCTTGNPIHSRFFWRRYWQADSLFATAQFLKNKARKKYRFSQDVKFLPSPAPFFEKTEKSETPLVAFLGRFDRRKRPHKFFNLAKKFPNVHFAAVGISQNTIFQNRLKKEYGGQKNLEFLGFLNQFEDDKLSKLLSKTWILINTSKREGLPTSFIEAAGHKCAILSNINADNFSSEFGYHVENDDFTKGLNFLLENDRWREKGLAGYSYVKDLYSLEKAMEKHINIYADILGEE
jgi:glycosyltransferase involved in cell wall biosynthesis